MSDYGISTEKGIYSTTTLDCNYIDFANKKLIKQVKKIVFDTAEKINLFVWNNYPGIADTQDFQRIFGVPFNSNKAAMCCSHFPYAMESPAVPCGIRMFRTQVGVPYNYFLIIGTDFTGLIDFKAYLTEQMNNGTPLTFTFIPTTAEEVDLSQYITEDKFFNTENAVSAERDDMTTESLSNTISVQTKK